MSAGAWVCRSVGDAYVTYWATLMPADEKLCFQSVSRVAESAAVDQVDHAELAFLLGEVALAGEGGVLAR